MSFFDEIKSLFKSKLFVKTTAVVLSVALVATMLPHTFGDNTRETLFEYEQRVAYERNHLDLRLETKRLLEPTDFTESSWLPLANAYEQTMEFLENLDQLQTGINPWETFEDTVDQEYGALPEVTEPDFTLEINDLRIVIDNLQLFYRRLEGYMNQLEALEEDVVTEEETTTPIEEDEVVETTAPPQDCDAYDVECDQDDADEADADDSEPLDAITLLINIFELAYYISQLDEEEFTGESWENLQVAVDDTFESLEEIGLNMPREMNYFGDVMQDVMVTIDIIAQEIEVLYAVYENLKEAFNLLVPLQGRVYITFLQNGGENAEPGVTRRHTENYLVVELPQAPSRIGYSFLHWNTRADGEGEIVTYDFYVTEDIYVYAIWGFLIEFDGNGGELLTSGILEPGDEGYDEWREEYEAFILIHGEDWEEVLNWWIGQEECYRLTFGLAPICPNHPGPRPPEGPSRYRSTPNYATNHLPRIVRENSSVNGTIGMTWPNPPGHATMMFRGWTLEASGGADYCPSVDYGDEYAEPCFLWTWIDGDTIITQNMTVTAQWEQPRRQNIYFHGNGGTLAHQSAGVSHREVAIGARRAVHTRGYTVLHASNALFDTNSGVPYRDRAPMFFHPSLALFGWYTAPGGNRGEGEFVILGSQAMSSGQPIDNVWWTPANLIIRPSLSDLIEPLDLYAHWGVELTFDNNITDGIAPYPIPNLFRRVEYGENMNTSGHLNVNPMLPIPIRSGFVFDGWFTGSSVADARHNANYDVREHQVDEMTVFFSNTILYARWIPEGAVTITLNIGAEGATWQGVAGLNNGQITRTPSMNSTFRDNPRGPTGQNAIPTTLPERGGYVFMGWKNLETEELFTAYDIVFDNLALEAIWHPSVTVAIAMGDGTGNTLLNVPLNGTIGEHLIRRIEAIGLGDIAHGHGGLGLYSIRQGIALPIPTRNDAIALQYFHAFNDLTDIGFAGGVGQSAVFRDIVNGSTVTHRTQISEPITIEPIWVVRLEINDNISGSRNQGGANFQNDSEPWNGWYFRHALLNTSILSGEFERIIDELERDHYKISGDNFLPLPNIHGFDNGWFAVHTHLATGYRSSQLSELRPVRNELHGPTFMTFPPDNEGRNRERVRADLAGNPLRDEAGMPLFFDIEEVLTSNARIVGYFVQGVMFDSGTTSFDVITDENRYRQGNIPYPIGYENWVDDPVYPGETFSGWNTEPDASGIWISYDTPLWSTFTLYAIWGTTFYFHANFEGGYMQCIVPDTEPLEREDCDYSAMLMSVGLPLGQRFDQIATQDLPERSNWRIHHWNTNPLGTGLMYTATAPVVTINRHVFAQWGANIRFELQGGELYDVISVDEEELEPLNEMTYVLSDLILEGTSFGEYPIVSREGYRFVEFNSQPSGEGHTFDSETLMLNGDVTYYAIWEEVDQDYMDGSFIKYSLERNTPLPGAVFYLYAWNEYENDFDESSRLIVTSDENGFVELVNILSNGYFRLVEMTAPYGYVLPLGHWYLTTADGMIYSVQTNGVAPDFSEEGGLWRVGNNPRGPITGLNDEFVLSLTLLLVGTIGVFTYRQLNNWKKKNYDV